MRSWFLPGVWPFPKPFPLIMLLTRSTHSERQEPNEFRKQMVLLNHDVFGHKRRYGIHEKKNHLIRLLLS